MFNFFRRRKTPIKAAPAEVAGRLPPGQNQATRWPVLHSGKIPEIDLATWSLEVWGAVEQPCQLSWAEFQELPRIRLQADMHCVTWWTRLDQVWEGVPLDVLAERCRPLGSARHGMACSYGEPEPGQEYCTNIPAEYLTDALLATHCNGQPLSPEHGGPLRLVVPRLYAWKSAKWLRSLEYLEEERLGYWETLGYHERGDPWREERMKE